MLPLNFNDPTGLSPEKEKGDKLQSIVLISGNDEEIEEVYNVENCHKGDPNRPKQSNDEGARTGGIASGPGTTKSKTDDEESQRRVGFALFQIESDKQMDDLTSQNLNNLSVNSGSNLGKSIINNFQDNKFDKKKSDGAKSAEETKNNAAGRSREIEGSIFAKTYFHYQFGKREPLTVSTSELDFSFVTQGDLQFDDETGLYTVNLFNLNPTSPTSLALGKIALRKVSKNSFTIENDDYDFNIEWDQGFSKRNIATYLAGLIHGPVVDDKPILFISPLFTGIGPSLFFGGKYTINFDGTIYIRP